MGTTGFKRLDTRPKRRSARLGAVLVLGLLAVSCSGPGDDGEMADSVSGVSEAPAVDSGAEADSRPADVGGDRDSFGQRRPRPGDAGRVPQSHG